MTAADRTWPATDLTHKLVCRQCTITTYLGAVKFYELGCCLPVKLVCRQYTIKTYLVVVILFYELGCCLPVKLVCRLYTIKTYLVVVILFYKLGCCPPVILVCSVPQHCQTYIVSVMHCHVLRRNLMIRYFCTFVKFINPDGLN